MFNLSPAIIISRIITLLIAFTVHEFSHAWVATYFGDDTPRLYGRLTLNPVAHLDLVGTLMLLFAGFGWAKPVPVNPYALNRRSPSAIMWVSLAGPASNLVLAVLGAIPLRMQLLPISYSTSGYLPSFSSFLLQFIYINLILALFNLIPLAPLDGDKILSFLLPPSVGRFFETIRPYGPAILLALVFLLPLIGVDVIGYIISPALSGILRLLIGG